jgi:MFS transporter, NNP family, nitrate/nitrite transporter
MSSSIDTDPAGPRRRVLWLSTTAFTLLFAVWLMFGMLAVQFKDAFALTPDHLYALTITAVLAGSLLRFNFGVWADRYGGRKVMTLLLLLPVVPTALVAFATEFWHLLVLAGLFGLAGNSFSVGIAWCAAWYPKEKQGLALGVFGAGNVGASATKLFGPAVIALVPTAFLSAAIPDQWRFIPLVYAALLVLMAAAVWLFAPTPDRTPAKARAFAEVVKPLGKLKVWEYSLHYVVVFGAYVALSGLLPTYYVTVYGSELAGRLGLNPDVPADKNAMIAWVGVLAAVCFVFPASLLRPLGGYLSDKFGARGVMAVVFWGMLLAGVVLTFFPAVGVWGFTAGLFVLGVGMGVGKASVYKMIPDAFPNDVGAVGGLVGLLGALGGVLVPLLAGPLQKATGSPQMLFGVLLGLTAVSTGWFYAAGWLAKPAAVREPATVGTA